MNDLTADRTENRITNQVFGLALLTATGLLLVVVCGRSLRSVDVAAVPDTEHDDFSPVVVDAVEDAIGAASSAQDALQLVAERAAYPPRVVE